VFLEKIKLRNFKSHASAELKAPARLNIIVGANGSGKTNFLDALYLLCQTKSFLLISEQQLLRKGADFFRIEARSREENGSVYLEAVYTAAAKKEIRTDQEPVKRLSDFIGRFPVVLISPEDSGLILSGSEERRKFLDYTISQTSREYLETLMQYNRVLQQRNALLRALRPYERPEEIQLAYFNQVLSETGGKIHRARKAFLSDLLPAFRELYAEISLEREKIEIEYHSQLNENRLEDLLAGGLDRDIMLQRTECGIHKDELHFLLDGRRIRKFASQGQQKTMLFSLRLAQFDWIRNHSQKVPLLLIDDIFDKLDEERMEKLMGIINSDFTAQVFITDTGGARISQLKEKFPEINIIHIETLSFAADEKE
jgi:DNA replication and repair protein RecF